jgi:hypothetical protein
LIFLQKMPSLASRKNRDAAAMVTRYSDGPKPGVLEALVFGFQGKPIDKQSRLTLSAPRPGTRRLDQRSAFVVGTSSRPQSGNIQSLANERALYQCIGLAVILITKH